MLAKLITRPDVVKSGELENLLEQLSVQFAAECNEQDKLHKCAGILLTLVQIFKTGHRNDLIDKIKIVFENALKAEIENQNNKKSSFIKKAKVNLAQRIGMIFLKPKVAKWRYQRGSRSLSSNLVASNVEIISSQGINKVSKPAI